MASLDFAVRLRVQVAGWPGMIEVDAYGRAVKRRNGGTMEAKSYTVDALRVLCNELLLSHVDLTTDEYARVIEARASYGLANASAETTRQLWACVRIAYGVAVRCGGSAGLNRALTAARRVLGGSDALDESLLRNGDRIAVTIDGVERFGRVGSVYSADWVAVQIDGEWIDMKVSELRRVEERKPEARDPEITRCRRDCTVCQVRAPGLRWQLGDVIIDTSAGETGVVVAVDRDLGAVKFMHDTSDWRSWRYLAHRESARVEAPAASDLRTHNATCPRCHGPAFEGIGLPRCLRSEAECEAVTNPRPAYTHRFDGGRGEMLWEAVGEVEKGGDVFCRRHPIEAEAIAIWRRDVLAARAKRPIVLPPGTKVEMLPPPSSGETLKWRAMEEESDWRAPIMVTVYPGVMTPRAKDGA